MWQLCSGLTQNILVHCADSTFGSLEGAKAEFNAAAVGHFGAGWIWLSLKDDGGSLSITSTPKHVTAVSMSASWKLWCRLKLETESAWYFRLMPDVVCERTLQDNPLQAAFVAEPGIPILGLDVWEHSYYLTSVPLIDGLDTSSRSFWHSAHQRPHGSAIMHCLLGIGFHSALALCQP